MNLVFFSILDLLEVDLHNSFFYLFSIRLSQSYDPSDGFGTLTTVD